MAPLTVHVIPALLPSLFNMLASYNLVVNDPPSAVLIVKSPVLESIAVEETPATVTVPAESNWP